MQGYTNHTDTLSLTPPQIFTRSYRRMKTDQPHRVCVSKPRRVSSFTFKHDKKEYIIVWDKQASVMQVYMLQPFSQMFCSVSVFHFIDCRDALCPMKSRHTPSFSHMSISITVCDGWHCQRHLVYFNRCVT